MGMNMAQPWAQVDQILHARDAIQQYLNQRLCRLTPQELEFNV